MNKRILIVDDDVDIIEPLSLLLERKGYTIASITKGKEIYERVKNFKPDLILLDILMSGSDGRVICKRLKKDQLTKKITIIMMSAHPGADKDSERAGADDFIAKPFEVEDLFTILQKYS